MKIVTHVGFLCLETIHQHTDDGYGYSIIVMLLQKLALQWHTQSAESKRHVTLPVPSKKTDELAAAAAHAGQPQKPQAIPLQLYMNVS